MTRLVRVELRRFFSRRLTKLACLGVLVVLAIALFGIQQQTYDSVPSRVQERTQQQIKQCESAQAGARQQDPSADFRCAEMAGQLEGQPTPSFVATTREAGQGLALLFAVVGFLIGATFLAAEFTSGALGNWLTFEPRRRRVYVSKMVAAALGSVPLTVVGLGLLAGGVAFVTRYYGMAGAVPADQRNSLGWLALRIVVITAASTVGGASLGGLLRNTAAALGVTLAYAVLVEGIFPALIQRLVSDPRPWLIQSNFQAWVNHGLRYYVSPCDESGGQGMSCEGVERTLTFAHGSIYLAVLLVVFLALGGWVFSRRDVS